MSKHEAMKTDETSKVTLGFWIYLMTDCILFGSLFATFIVLRAGDYGMTGVGELFDMPFILVETLVLLFSSFVCGMALLAAKAHKKAGVIAGLVGTFALGAVFLGMELSEFTHLVHEGHGWWTTAYMSAFFTLVGTHGAHIAVGLLWAAVLIVRIWRSGLTEGTMKKVGLFALFWHFLDVVWIFIFTIVYLMGVL